MFIVFLHFFVYIFLNFYFTRGLVEKISRHCPVCVYCLHSCANYVKIIRFSGKRQLRETTLFLVESSMKRTTEILLDRTAGAIHGNWHGVALSRSSLLLFRQNNTHMRLRAHVHSQHGLFTSRAPVTRSV